METDKLERVGDFMSLYKDLIWAIFMFFFVIIDLYVVITDFNVLSLIGLICCGISGVMNIISFVILYKESSAIDKEK